MTRPRGDKTSKADQEARRKATADLMADGFSHAEATDILGVKPSTVWRDLAVLTERFKEASGPKYQEFVAAQVAVFELMEKSLIEGKIDHQTSNAWRGIRSEISTLLGLNAPSRSVSVTVDAEEGLVGYKRFRYETRFLSQEQLEQVYAFTKKLNVPPTVQVIGPPSSSPLWEEPKQPLGEGQ
jgi:hypothetical protein